MTWPKNPKRPSVEEAKEMLDSLVQDRSGAYLNLNGEATKEEQNTAIQKADQLREIIAGKREWL